MRTTRSFRSCWNLFRSTGEARGNRASWRRGPYVWASIAAAVIGLALSVAGWLVVSAWENQLAEHELSGRANSHALPNGHPSGFLDSAYNAR